MKTLIVGFDSLRLDDCKLWLHIHQLSLHTEYLSSPLYFQVAKLIKMHAERAGDRERETWT